MFHVGQKVVCIKEGPWIFELSHPDWVILYKPAIPRYENICTIREKRILAKDGGLYLRFHEYNNKHAPVNDSDEMSFHAIQFRPLTERKNDGEAFVRKLKEDCLPKKLEVAK